ncbi:BT_3928 family protein [Abyssalbus ytuae]|uniref:DoxX family protein n=1 Tax=Abyssalbus ytuae TaxID=2926907 RepID=A0A9E7A3S2_9FLAO|nr:BT_3928 family protein [Abyssalbus ytuae]UOB19341.1 DoxX family protein [Abyssalbus ytuae]
MSKKVKNLLIFFRIILGLIFIFSGLVKGNDPLGTSYKLTDYFSAFHLEFLSPLSLFFSFLLNMSEFVLGVCLLFGVFINIFSWMALIYMSFFTLLTFILAIYNPVTDCGCFGDAIKLTNWQTFYKNVFIILLLVPVFLKRKSFQTPISYKRDGGIIIISSIVFLFISAYAYNHLPFIDFRPYKEGADIVKEMQIPEGAPLDSFSNVLVYRKGKVLKEFAVDNLPYKDTAWKWVETKSKLIRKGYSSPIHDFSFTNNGRIEVTDSILQDTSYVFLAVSHSLEKASEKGLEKLTEVYNYCQKKGYRFYLATASGNKETEHYTSLLHLPYSFYVADEIMLKTVVRANPGLVLIKKGTIIKKWHYNDFPGNDDLENIHAVNNKKNDNR